MLLCPRSAPDPALLAALTRRSVHLSVAAHTVDAMAALCADAAESPDRARLLILCAAGPPAGAPGRVAVPSARALHAAALLCRAARAYVPRVSLWTFWPAAALPPLPPLAPAPPAPPVPADHSAPAAHAPRAPSLLHADAQGHAPLFSGAKPGLQPLPDHAWSAWLVAGTPAPLARVPSARTPTHRTPTHHTQTPRAPGAMNGSHAAPGPAPLPFQLRNVREDQPSGPRLVYPMAHNATAPQPVAGPLRIEVHEPVSLTSDELAMLLGDHAAGDHTPGDHTAHAHSADGQTPLDHTDPHATPLDHAYPADTAPPHATNTPPHTAPKTPPHAPPHAPWMPR
ncbi:MAG: hypothetical protein C0475_03225 [Planctomyces sp.]|nr:hypothetical protein [Planctomyces sp.]